MMLKCLFLAVQAGHIRWLCRIVPQKPIYLSSQVDLTGQAKMQFARVNLQIVQAIEQNV